MPKLEAARAMARLRNVADLFYLAPPQSSSNTKAVVEGFSSPVVAAIRCIEKAQLNGFKTAVRHTVFDCRLRAGVDMLSARNGYGFV